METFLWKFFFFMSALVNLTFFTKRPLDLINKPFASWYNVVNRDVNDILKYRNIVVETIDIKSN